MHFLLTKYLEIVCLPLCHLLTGESRGPIRTWPHPKPLKGSFGPTQNAMNVIMDERIVKKFEAIFTVSWSRKKLISRLQRSNSYIYHDHVN